jgi:hypothetical protein
VAEWEKDGLISDSLSQLQSPNRMALRFAFAAQFVWENVWENETSFGFVTLVYLVVTIRLAVCIIAVSQQQQQQQQHQSLIPKQVGVG